MRLAPPRRAICIAAVPMPLLAAVIRTSCPGRSDPRVIARQEDLWNLPPPELGGPRVVRVFEPAVESGGEALDLSRPLGERAGQPTRDRVDDRERGNLPAGEHIRPDGHCISAEVIQDSLVEAFEPCGEKREDGLGSELLDELLIELPPLRRQGDDPMLWDSTVERVERGRDDVDPKHHPGPASVRIVVDLAGAERCRVAVVEDPEIELGSEHRSDRAALLQPCEGSRDKGEDVEAHGAEP